MLHEPFFGGGDGLPCHMCQVVNQKLLASNASNDEEAKKAHECDVARCVTILRH